MTEKIRTEFRDQQHLEKRIDLSPEDKFVYTELSDFLEVNQDVKKYTPEEAGETLKKFQELERLGIKKILYVVQSAFTAPFVRNEIPAILRPFVEEMYYKVDDQIIQTDERFLENIIQVDSSGNIKSESQKKMDDLVKDRAGIFLGGGPNFPTDPCRGPILKSIEKAVKEGTPIFGICLGHQDLGHLAGYELVPGMVDAGPQVERITEEGKNNKIYGRVGDKFGSNSFNTGIIIPGKEARVLAVGLSNGNFPTVLQHDGFEYPGQAISSQFHPEISVGTGYEGEKFTEKEEVLELDGKKIIIPSGLSMGMRKIIEFAISGWDKFKKAGMTPEDVQDLMRPERIYPTLGRNVIGPALDWMAETTMKNLNKRK